jgi:hypothetical protein
MITNLKLMITAGLMATAMNSFSQPILPTNVVNLGDRELRFGEPVELPWETPETLVTFPYITPDGLTQFFGSDRPGGVGQRDIWVTTRPTLSAPWGTPINVGAPVNTTAIEDDPFLLPHLSGRFSWQVGALAKPHQDPAPVKGLGDKPGWRVQTRTARTRRRGL